MAENEKNKLNMSYDEMIKNASVHAENSEDKKGAATDSTLKRMGDDAKRGQFDFINVSVIGLVILIMGLSFALLRDTGDPDAETVKPTVMGLYDGSYTSYLSKSYENALPGKSILASVNSFFSNVYGAKKYNTHQNFITPLDENGNPINVLTAASTTTTTTTTQYTGKTSNTTKKINRDDMYIGPQTNLWTTTTTKKTTTTTEVTTTSEETTEETTAEVTTTTTEEEVTQAATTVKIDLEDIVFTKDENGKLSFDYVIDEELDVTDYSQVLLSYEFFGQTQGYFIRPYIEYRNKNIGENVNPIKDTAEFDVSRISGSVKLGIRFIARENSDIQENDIINVKLHYGLGSIN